MAPSQERSTCNLPFILRFFLCCILLLSSEANASAVMSVPVQRAPNKKETFNVRLPPWSQKVISGGAGRAMAQALLYPVDALRTLAQTRDGRTLADVGVQALSKGCLQTSSVALLQGAIQFGIFGVVNERYGPLVASALGAAGSCIVSVPQEVLKQRLVTGVYSRFREAVTTIYSTEGIRGFYSGWRPTVSRNVPFVVITFTTMHYMEQKILAKRKRDGPKTLTAKENMLIGIGSALVGVWATQPFDVIKTRMMTQAASKAVPYSSAFECFSMIVRSEGVRKLYNGVAQRSVYQAGLWGITFAVNGILRSRLKEEEKVKATKKKKKK